MKLLIVLSVDPWTRSVSTIHKYVAAGRALGHEVAVYGPPHAELPALPFTTDLNGVDLALFVVQVPTDFPDMPYLARLLDGIPRDRRVVVDLWGRFNDTIRLEHDFNHLEKLDGHAGWEWEDAIRAVSGTILQPTFAPLRPNVRSFLFHGYDPGSVAKPYASAAEAAASWCAAGPAEKPNGVMYVGSNWQRWEQVRQFLEGYAPAREQVGRACLVGWDWSARPGWAVQCGIMGIDTDPALLARLDVEVLDGVRFHEVVGLLGKARFAPVFHRPLFRHLGIVTNRTFETFYADSVPVLMLPRDLVAAVYGTAALTLVPGDNVSAHLTDALRRPEVHWDAVLKTRLHLARHHSYAQRFEELGALAAIRVEFWRSAVNILFVMKHRGNAGNTHAVANYMRVAPKYGHSVAIYGTPISYVPELQFSMDIQSFDRVVYVYESELYRIKPMQEAVMLGKFPRQHRLILDSDGMYNPVVNIDGYDFNHRDESERARWIEHLDALGDRIVQTTFARPINPRASAMTFYGYNPALRIDASATPPKQYDILHVGHNWWRWKQVCSELLPAFEQIRGQVGGIAFIGLWWDKPPPEGPAAGPEEAFQSDPEAFRRLRIQTPKAVMYHDVVQTMSTARINILTQRPVLRHLKHLTLKYFEIFCAETIPLLMLDGGHAEAVYGPAARELVLSGQVAEKLLDALHRPDHYRGIVEDVRRHLIAHYSYDQRVEELIAAVRN